MPNRLLEDVDSVFRRDPAARSRLEVILCYPGFHAVLFYRLSHWLWKRKMRLPARIFSQLARFFTGIEIHPGATIGRHFFIDHGMGVVIGETASIGDNVTIYHGVTLGGVSSSPGIRHPQIGNGVIIGSGAQLLGPIQVGDNARIGSNAVVVKDVPEGATMVGIPAKAVKRAAMSESEAKEFDAYGVHHGEIPDPVARAFEVLTEQVARLSGRVIELEQQNKGIEETAGNWEMKKTSREETL